MRAKIICIFLSIFLVSFLGGCTAEEKEDVSRVVKSFEDASVILRDKLEEESTARGITQDNKKSSTEKTKKNTTEKKVEKNERKTSSQKNTEKTTEEEKTVQDFSDEEPEADESSNETTEDDYYVDEDDDYTTDDEGEIIQSVTYSNDSDDALYYEVVLYENGNVHVWAYNGMDEEDYDLESDVFVAIDVSSLVESNGEVILRGGQIINYKYGWIDLED